MKKIVVSLVIIVLLIAALSVRAFAAEDILSEMTENTGLERELTSEAADVLDGFSVSDGLDPDKGIGLLYSSALSTIKEIFPEALRSGAALVIIGLLSHLSSSVCGDNKKVRFAADIACALAVFSTAAKGTGSFGELCLTAAEDINIFSKALLPCLAASAAGSGAVTSAAAKFAATALFMDTLITLIKSFVMPLIFSYMAVGLAGCIVEGTGVRAAANLIKWIIVTALTAMVLAFTIYLSVTGVIASTADATATKLAKTAIGAALPIVGGIISDAAGTVVSGMGLLKNAVGVFGLIATVAICLAPCIKLTIHFLVYKAAAAVTESVSENVVVRMISMVSTAYGMMLAAIGTGAMMLFISVISLMKVVNGGA